MSTISEGREDKMKKGIRILLVDDSEVVRSGLRLMLEAEEDVDVVGDCTSADEALSQAGTLSPDVILMDMDMPGMDGIEATRCLKRNGLNCEADVIILAECTDYLVNALDAGAAGYLPKDMSRQELGQAIREVYEREHLPTDGDGFVEQVELLITQPADAAQLRRFAGQVETTLQASIVETVGSWHWGAAITVLLEHTRLAGVLDRLWSMPDLEKVEELPSTGVLPSLVGKFRTLLRSRTIPTKTRLLVTLKETSVPEQELAAALN